MSDTAFVTSVLAQTTAIVIVAWCAARLVAPRHPALRHAIWLSALACVIASPLLSRAAPRAGLSVVAARAPAPPAWPAFSLGDLPVAAAPSPPRPAPSAPIAWRSWLLPAWLAGAVLQLVRLAWGMLRVHSIRRRAVAIADGIATSPDIVSPIALGVWHPIVVLPDGLLARLDEPALFDVLAHERAHIARRDAAVGVVQRLTAAAYWFHPLVHLLNRELSRAREELCDNHVLATRARVDYARTLLASVPERSPRASMPAPALWWPRLPLADRIAGLLDERRVLMTRLPRWPLTLVVLGTLCALAAMAATSPAAPPQAIDVSGEWRGAPWGKLVVRGDVATYEHGAWRFALTGRRSFSGFWKESDGYGGTLRFTLAPGGEQITGSFEVDANADHAAASHAGFTLTLAARLTPASEEPAIVTRTQVPNPEYAAAQAKVLAAQKMLQAYVAKGYTQQHPLLQRAQHELDLAMQQLATFDKFLVSEWRTEVHRVEPRFPDNAAEMRPWLLEVLGTTSLEQGDLDRALTLLRQALAATSAPRGDAQALRIQTEIGAVLQRQGRIEEAIALFEQALAQQARVLGEQHPDLLLTSVQLAEARAAAGDLAPAAELLRTTLEKSIAALGEQCPTSQRCLTDLVQVLKALGRTDEANALARRIKRPI